MKGIVMRLPVVYRILVLLFSVSACASGRNAPASAAPETSSKPAVSAPTTAPSAESERGFSEAPAFDASECETWIRRLPGALPPAEVSRMCARARQIPECKSQKGHPIFHVEREGFETGPKKKRVLVFGLIHGDEGASGSLARDWLNRLLELERIRNTWRVLPVLNPDGFIAKTRTNARGIDLNRNFPTRDWNETAQAYWKKEAGANPRRFPGSQPGSEPETQCAVRQIDDFKPDLVISIHTPYRIIDMDGPHIQVPPFRALPFRRLGHFPGSLGRYMWRDREVPVVTIELGDGRRPLSSTEEKLLQDIMGDIAIRSGAALGRP